MTSHNGTEREAKATTFLVTGADLVAIGALVARFVQRSIEAAERAEAQKAAQSQRITPVKLVPDS